MELYEMFEFMNKIVIINSSFGIHMTGLTSTVFHNQIEYNVQTEDKGPSGYYIETTIFCYGKILASKKISYAFLLNDPDLIQKRDNLLKKQHSECVREIQEGKYHSE